MNSSSPSWSMKPFSTRYRRTGSALRSNGARPFHASDPQPAADPVFLQAQRQQLLGDDVPRLRRRHHRLDVALAPQVQQPGGPQQRRRCQREEQAVPAAPGPPSGPPDALQECGDVGGSSTWMTRSRSPTSIPSSSVEVATITQSRASANACSARRRSSSDRDAWDRNVVTPVPAARRRSPRPAAGSRRTPAASRPVQRGDHVAACSPSRHNPARCPQAESAAPAQNGRRRNGQVRCHDYSWSLFLVPIPAASRAARPGCRRGRQADPLEGRPATR